MIHVENTPNPNALKFLSEKKISSVGTQEFQKANIKKIKNLKNDQAYLLKILHEGTEKANSIAEKNLDKVKEIVGFVLH